MQTLLLVFRYEYFNMSLNAVVAENDLNFLSSFFSFFRLIITATWHLTLPIVHIRLKGFHLMAL